MGDAREIAGRLSPGEIKMLERLAEAGPDGLKRRRGWKAREVMMKGLSEWYDPNGGNWNEVLTNLGREVLAARAHWKEGD